MVFIKKFKVLIFYHNLRYEVNFIVGEIEVRRLKVTLHEMKSDKKQVFKVIKLLTGYGQNT